jgi:integrase
MDQLTPYKPEFDYSALELADIAPTTRRVYMAAIVLLLAANVNPYDFPALQAYAAGLSPMKRSHLKSALKILTMGDLTRAKSQATPQNVDAIQAIVYRLDAMSDAIHVKTEKGTRFHTWLTAEQVTEITSIPDRSTLAGMRDFICLATLLATGLRREEFCNLTFSQLRQQGNRYLLDIVGKGRKKRSIPISRALAGHLKQWERQIGGGNVARSLINGTLGESMTPDGLFRLVKRYGAMIGADAAATHDTRRTYAMLGLEAGIPIHQISVLMGHESIDTTERYLNLTVDMERTISDYIPIAE